MMGFASLNPSYELSFVMAGLVPAIHVFAAERFKTWMPATSAGMTSGKPSLRSHPRLSQRIRDRHRDLPVAFIREMDEVDELAAAAGAVEQRDRVEVADLLFLRGPAQQGVDAPD